jgi:type VI secretion system protein ImpJ
MTGDSRVAWREGLFLRPQHFQQQDRFVESLVRGRTETLTPYPWGLAALSLDESLASLGKFAVARCAGAMPDGTPFSIPGDVPPPEPLAVPADARDATIYLTLPARQSGAVEFAERGRAGAALVARQLVDEEGVYDAFANERVSEPIEVARLNLRYGLTRDQTEGRICMGVARVREVVNGSVVLDDRYIPPALDIRASPRLTGFLKDVIGRAEQRVDELADRAVEATDGGAETFASFLLLQALNRWIPVLWHLEALPLVRPERLYEAFCSMSGELATLVNADLRRPPRFPPYVHDDLQGTFDLVYTTLQAQLSAMFERSAEQMRLETVGPGSYTAVITNHSLFQSCSFYLAVSARTPMDEIRARFASHTKLGSVLKMRQLVASALPGVGLVPTPTPPPQLRVLPGNVYFELDRTAPEWRDFATAPALGLHVAGEWPELKLELWWVKRASR